MKVNYTDASKTYDRHRSYPKSLMEKLVGFGGISDGMLVLDVGCGTGNVASRLRELVNVDIVGLDISLPMLKMAKGKSLEVICASADNSRLPFRDSSFDRVIAAYVIHQIDNLSLLFSECYRILRNGMLLLLTASHGQIEHRHPVIKRFFPAGTSIDKGRFPDVSHVDYLLGSIGFRNVKHQSVLIESIAIDEEFLDRVKNKYVSTYRLMPQKDFEIGVSLLEDFIKTKSHPELMRWRGTLIYGQK